MSVASFWFTLDDLKVGSFLKIALELAEVVQGDLSGFEIVGFGPVETLGEGIDLRARVPDKG